jgi:cell wall-associated NlpC family hydrolase
VLVLCAGIVGLPLLLLGQQQAEAAACNLNVVTPNTTATAPGAPSPPAGDLVSKWTTEQLANAAVIVAVGQQMSVPPRGYVVALATATQESGLRNLGDLGDHNDHDSLGLFQQRPSQGWGTPAQLLDPRYASRKFYEKLLTVAGWQKMLTDAAQAVQHSGQPDAYQKWQADAEADAAFLDGCATLQCALDAGDGHTGDGPVPLPPGFTLPPGTPPAVVTAIAWVLQQLGTPYSFGGDCTDAHSGNRAHQCDCSSLVQQAYRAAGITLPRVTTQQVKVGQPIFDPNQLRPGDLLFIPGSDGIPEAPGHVGLYLGSGLLVQAPHTGDFVKVTKLSTWLVARR